MTVSARLRQLAPAGVGAALTCSAAIHLLRPGAFRSLIPDAFPAPDVWIRTSGVVEGVCGVGLLTSQPWAGRAAAALLLVVWPGNVQMALDAGSGRNPGLMNNPLVAWGRLPLQVPLVWAARLSRPNDD